MVLTRCPVCTHDLTIRRLECGACGTAVEGQFQLGWLRQLTAEQLAFLKVFVESRGKIKDVEAALDLSYPTVVARLEEVVQALKDAPAPPPPEPPSKKRLEVLESLAKGQIDAAEAARLLKKP
jgi:hypothetical protein